MRKIGKCLDCGTEFKYESTQKTGKYCNNKCQQNYQYKTKTKPKVEQGLMTDRNVLKNYLIRERGGKCEICGLEPEWRGEPLPLIVDHINGDSDNHFPENIRLVCPNCNSQLPTTKNRNKKNCKRNVYLRGYRKTHVVRN